MRVLIRILALKIALLVASSGFAQEDSGRWRWHQPLQEEVALLIGADTIARPARPIADSDSWWEAFGYPALDSLVEKAKANNFELKVAQALVEQARAKRRIALADMFPSVQFEPSALRQGLSANRPNPFGGQLDAVTFNTYDLPLTLSYELDVFGKNNDRVLANTLISRATEEQKRNVLLDLVSEVAQNYFLILQLDAENDLLRNTLETRRNNLDITSTRYEAGLVSQIDVLRAKTELSSIQVQLKSNSQIRAEIELLLATLSGQDASGFRIPPTRISYLPPPVMFLVKDSLAGNRPDLKAAGLFLEAGEKLVRSQKKQLLPSFYVDGSYGYLSGEGAGLISDSGENWMVGVSAALPIFQGGRKRSEIQLRKSELEETGQRLSQQVLLSHQQVEQAYAGLKWVHDQLLAQQEFVVAASDAAQLTRERYRKGLVNYLDVVDADRQVLEAEQLSVQLFGQELIGRVRLIRALGIIPDSSM